MKKRSIEIEDRSHLHLYEVRGVVHGNEETALVIAPSKEAARSALVDGANSHASSLGQADAISVRLVAPGEKLPITHGSEDGRSHTVVTMTAAEIIADEWIPESGVKVIASSEDME